ncbi:N-acetylmuramoyl-L-alanine amidase-like domain-containing protein [Runella sp. CRIBMP]|uniref:N-acetylmuramoyl-L-alanine amidase-like domain-containing protein n=1 Tax=Runella sp. CRIBMP TaxID=2683261 RepID=UPI001E56631F|nr:N-acetylmuramoyl-L-alanine amidase-like domain-containing protein [Runella sp. CRIBMP]
MMTKTPAFIFLLIGFFAKSLYAQTEAVFAEKMRIPPKATQAKTALHIAESFLGKPYVAHTLEKTPEALVCDLQNFDCYTFVESVLALTLTQKASGRYDEYQSFLQKLRYRKGKITGYGSRLHYFLEWKHQAVAQGWLVDVTESLGGLKIQPTIQFMTTHRGFYPALNDEKTLAEIQNAERQLSQIPWFYIPKNKVAAIESKLQDGDIIGITSGIAGLDFNHEGFVVRKGARAYLLHASSDLKKVTLSAEPLADYLAKIKKHSGVVVLRIND